MFILTFAIKLKRMEERVVLVDKDDKVIGSMEKMEAHIKAELHRAFSIFIFNSKGEMMIHQRALSKYHSPGLWTNACCSHPRMEESYADAAHRRLVEELGFDCELKEVFVFTYKADVGQGLTEHEIDHVFVGVYNEEPNINKDEVEDWKFVDPVKLYNDMKANPDNYTKWFHIAYEKLMEYSFENL